MRVESSVAVAEPPLSPASPTRRKRAAPPPAEPRSSAASGRSEESAESGASAASTAAGEETEMLKGDEFDMEGGAETDEEGEGDEGDEGDEGAGEGEGGGRRGTRGGGGGGRRPDEKMDDGDDDDGDARTLSASSSAAASSPKGQDGDGDGDERVLRAAKTTAILDWDDTICPSTHLSQLGMRVDDADDLPPALRAQLAQLEAAVINIMREALRFGAVVVITNAEAGWVELSGRRFLPDVVDFIRAHDIKIVSARSSFERDFPDAPSSWKVAAFSQEVTHMFPDEDELNVLVLGDSMSERDAAHALGSRMPNSKVKTVKFVERPSIDQLMRQVQLVAQSLPDLASYSSSFDVDLVVSAWA